MRVSGKGVLERVNCFSVRAQTDVVESEREVDRDGRIEIVQALTLPNALLVATGHEEVISHEHVDDGRERIEPLSPLDFTNRLIRQHIDPLAPGQLLEIRSRESSVAEDLPAWCRLTGNELVSVTLHWSVATP